MEKIKLYLQPSVKPLLAQKILAFLEWFEQEYEMPEKLNMTITGARHIINIEGQKVLGTCYCPNDRSKSMSIKIATGDFFEMLKKEGKENAIYRIFHSILHELQHYYQFANDWALDEDEADEVATELLYRYIEDLEQ